MLGLSFSHKPDHQDFMANNNTHYLILDAVLPQSGRTGLDVLAPRRFESLMLPTPASVQ